MQETQTTPLRPGPHPAWGLAVLAAGGGGAAAILLGVPYGFGVLLQVPAIAAMPPAAIEALFTLTIFGLLALVAFAGIGLSRLALPLGTRPALAAGGGLGLGVLAFAVSVALCVIAGTARGGMPASEGLGLLLLETVLLLIQSGAEEAYFRGWLQADLQRRWGVWPALAAASVLFAALHFVIAAGQPLSFATLLLGGLLFGLAYTRSGSLLLPWGLHFGWNWAEELLFGLYPNPGTGTFGALLNIDTAGSAWWGGTDEGLNASLSSVIVLAAVLAALLAWPRSEPGPAPGPLTRSRGRG